ncbi:MAG: hypothetical protein RJB38_218 [Pseudomonadota bacterium]|jgi:geranylgeranyl diphosphate synthase type II
MALKAVNWEAEIQACSQLLLARAEAPNLVESIQYSLLSGGKRFRPKLMEASANLLEVSTQAYVPFAIGLEMIHTFTLIHDDLPCMDDDDFRRGKPTNHRVYGEAIALLAGDALVPLAFEACLEAHRHCESQSWTRALSRLLHLSGARGVIGGQAQEMLLSEERSLEKLLRMHRLKTGALFDAALLIPADLAGLSPSQVEMKALERFALAFGLAFQTADDLDDAEQERDAKTGLYPVTSILHYRTEAEARAEARRSLEESCEDLRRHWPQTCLDIEQIAGLLLNSLETRSS